MFHVGKLGHDGLVLHDSGFFVHDVFVVGLALVREPQADCLAGVWANHAQRKKDFIDPGDVEGAIGIATAIGDDRLQRQTQGQVVPESFTHGTSRQRVRWFKRGMDSGDVRQCDTFSPESL